MIKSADEYADIIMRDDRERIVSETPTIYDDERIERIYEFADGAVVKYEWHEFSDADGASVPQFNHRFTLVSPPDPNPAALSEGIIRTINYT